MVASERRPPAPPAMVAALEGRAAEGSDVRVPKTAELVAAHIRRRIVRGELRPGEALSGETALMSQFGISRPTLREAFRILESEALIRVRRGVHGGARVAAPDSAVAARYVSHILQYEAVSLADVHEARTALEAPAAARLASRPDHAARARRLRAYLDEAGDPEDLSRAVEIHAGFQRLVVELAGNRTVALLGRMLESVFAEAAAQYVREHETALTQQRRRRADRAHRRLVELVHAGDAAGAEELWRRHLTEIGRVLSRGTRAGATLEILR
ncbi:MAG TPA: GntR family transcriptional regulator [Candidatus Dormibacteraeota bacterium]|nr:GntR family transcriptional regulator [Candidatus Dormibacteraeota bacterium]